MAQITNGKAAPGVGSWIRRRSGFLGTVSLALVIAGPVTLYIYGLWLTLALYSSGSQSSGDKGWLVLAFSGALLAIGICLAVAVLRLGESGRTTSVIALCFAGFIAVSALTLAFYLTVGWEH